jgi:carboxymethylenebutenolidase
MGTDFMAGSNVKIVASDGFDPGAYRADAASPRGAVVVLQEIFGVNSHIRSICDRLTLEGYTAIAPALFDRQQRGFESGYSAEEVQSARRFIARPNLDELRRDADAAKAAVSSVGPVAVMGFCLGGSVAFAAATRSEGYVAAIGYYGAMIVRIADEAPRCLTILHYGETDPTIPLADAEAVRAKRPDVPVYIYPAGHGFACDQRPSFHRQSADLAWRRSLELLERASAP